MLSPMATLANFNRLFNQGKKNHFTIFGQNDKKKFIERTGKRGTKALNDDPTEGQADTNAAGKEIRVETMAGGALNINASNGTLEKSDLHQDETFQIKEEPDIAMETSQI